MSFLFKTVAVLMKDQDSNSVHVLLNGVLRQCVFAGVYVCMCSVRMK